MYLIVLLGSARICSLYLPDLCFDVDVSPFFIEEKRKANMEYLVKTSKRFIPMPRLRHDCR